MAKVKVYLEPGETEFDAEQALQKAFEHHSSGDAHNEESFDDPAMVDLANRLNQAHATMYAELTREITALLDEEFSDGHQ